MVTFVVVAAVVVDDVMVIVMIICYFQVFSFTNFQFRQAKTLHSQHFNAYFIQFRCFFLHHNILSNSLNIYIEFWLVLTIKSLLVMALSV